MVLSDSKSKRAHLYSLLVFIGCIVYLVLDVIVQLMPPHYSPIRQAESDLAVGPYGFIMNINFIVRGVLSFLMVLTLSQTMKKSAASRIGLVLLAIWSICSFLLAFIAFITGAVGELILSFRFSSTNILKPIKAVGLTLSILAILSLLAMTRMHHLGGLIERIFLLFILLWMFILALRVRTKAA